MQGSKRRWEQEEDEQQCFRAQLALGGTVLAVLLWIVYCLVTLLLRPDQDFE